jgi:hypothetical protein
MRYIHAAAAVPAAITAALLIAPMGVPAAHADGAGYRRCVGETPGLRMADPDPNSLYLTGLIEMDLKNGASPAAEASKVAQMGFEPHYASGVVHCVMQNNP